MAALRVRKINGLDRLNIFLRGGLITGNLFGSIYGLYNKTLIFVHPSAKTITFDTTNHSLQEPLSLVEIVDQINTGFGSIIAGVKGPELVFVESSPSAGITIDKDGTANTILGLSALADTTNDVYNSPGGGAPELVSVIFESTASGCYTVITKE